MCDDSRVFCPAVNDHHTLAMSSRQPGSMQTTPVTLTQLKHKRHYAEQSGFTLIELMITLVIAAVLISLAAPSFREIIDNNRVSAAANDFTASLALAKSEAVKRNGSAQLAPTAGGSDWSSGYKIGIDKSDPEDGDIDDAGVDKILKIVDAPATGTSVISAMTKIEYNSFGGVTSGGNFTFCADYAPRRIILITSAGVNTISKGSLGCP